MKKHLLIIAIILPFLWYQPKAKAIALTQPVKAPTTASWNLPKEIISQIKSTIVYRGVSCLLHRMFSFNLRSTPLKMMTKYSAMQMYDNIQERSITVLMN